MTMAQRWLPPPTSVMVVDGATSCQTYAPAVYQSSATLLSSLIFPPYEFVHCDLDDDPDDCQITGEYQQSDELSSSTDDESVQQTDLE
ncbi:GH18054 [Drosophila grimshawi]|uniref:GH18054 n=1 Tax=Drosophila grimshawi TaxID=7222 RepID=B4JHN6_DROGR|nr:GH18054 [Drosophila grimshawi]